MIWLTMKEKKAKTSSKTSFTAREVATLIEDLHTKFGTVAEQLESLADKVDATMGMVADNKQTLTMHGIRLSGIEDEMKKIKGKLVKIEDDVRVIKSDFGKRLTHLEVSRT